MNGENQETSLRRLFAEANQSLSQGDACAALLLAQQAWKLAPHLADCQNLLGVCAIAMGDAAGAERCWREALALEPNTLEARRNLARLCNETGRIDEAIGWLRELVGLAPDPDTLITLAQLQAPRDRSEAKRCYRGALELAPTRADARANLALLLEKDGEWIEAETQHRAALSLAPQSPDMHVNLGNLLRRQRRTAEAEVSYRRALALQPDSAVAHSNLGVLLAEDERETAAEQSLRQALHLRPNYPLARLNLAMLLLSQGRLEQAWPLHEARHHPDLPEPDAPLPLLPMRQWQGEPVSGKRLLLWPEQGYGDMIQFCRYLPLLQQQGAARIDIVCRKAQVGLLQTLRGVDRVVALEDALEDAAALLDGHDFWTLPMSLPFHFSTTLASIPAQLPYLYAHADKQAQWRPRLEHGLGRKIGLVWRGNPYHANDKQRSLPSHEVLSPLLAVPDANFFSLQPGNNEALPASLTDLGRDIADFADSAAIVSQLDLLITVDTAMAHLAGAMGKPCWILLPAYRTDWRWMRERGDSPWYPSVMRLYRQQQGEPWPAVLARVTADLAAFIQ